MCYEFCSSFSNPTFSFLISRGGVGGRGGGEVGGVGGGEVEGRGRGGQLVKDETLISCTQSQLGQYLTLPITIEDEV